MIIIPVSLTVERKALDFEIEVRILNWEPKSEYSIKAIMSAFQAEDVGSIPTTRTKSSTTRC